MRRGSLAKSSSETALCLLSQSLDVVEERGVEAALATCQYEGLLSLHAMEGICQSDGASLPPGMTSLFGFECPLGQEEPVADFLVRVGARQKYGSASALCQGTEG